MTTQNDERLLGILHAHGQQFMSCFDVPSTLKREVEDEDASESGEWTGFDSSPNEGTSVSDSEHDGVCLAHHLKLHLAEISTSTAFEHGDDSDSDESFVGPSPNVTVFLESRKQAADVPTEEFRKSFMSSKVCNVTSLTTQPASKKKVLDEDSDDERTNTQNDALLHRLVHTKLLSGSLNTELELDHAQRGRALAGRVLELAGAARLGKGESLFRQEQRNSAAKRVRDGLNRRKREHEQMALGEAKDLGNYHPSLKRLYDSNVSSVPKKKRARGLGMGVGKFAKGTLKLSRAEISSVTASGNRPRDNDRGRRQLGNKH